MKKVLAIFAIAGSLVACNSGSETTTTETTGDTATTITSDTTSVMTPSGDTTTVTSDTTKVVK